MNLDDSYFGHFIAGLRSGDRDVTREFCERFGPALVRIAGKQLPPGIQRRVGPEDVAQSACRSFLRRAGGGEFELPDSESLWQLLCAITLTKVREQTRFHMRKKRGIDREQVLEHIDANQSGAGFEPAANGPTPAEAAEFADHFQHLLEGLDDEERRIVDLKLQSYTNDQVAEALGCSERTVRRLVKRVQSHLTRVLETA